MEIDNSNSSLGCFSKTSKEHIQFLHQLSQIIQVQYFNPEIMREESAQRQRVSHKLKLCPEEFLPIIEGAIDGAIQIQQKNDETEGA